MSYLFDGMAGMLNPQLLRSAAGRSITCPDCGTILDESTTVIVTVGQGSRVLCGTCWDKVRIALADTVVDVDSLDVIDGRESR